MSRHNEIKNAYRSLGKEATFYDGMITCSTLPGQAVCGLVWNMGREKNTRYLEKALSGIPNVIKLRNFRGAKKYPPHFDGVGTLYLCADWIYSTISQMPDTKTSQSVHGCRCCRGRMWSCWCQR